MSTTTIRHYGRTFTVLATFPDTSEGRAQANAFMADNPNASVLCVVDGTAYIADSRDLGQIDTDPARLALANAQHQLQVAIGHLHAILNSRRTATQSWQAEQEARQWLESIGSEAP